MGGNVIFFILQWALACEEPYKIRVAQSIFFAGVMIGGLFFGVLGDRFGRRPVVLITVYSQAVLGFVLTFSPHYIMFVILKFFQGMMLQVSICHEMIRMIFLLYNFNIPP